MESSDHRWKFIRSGGIDQVVIRNGADIVNLEYLDQKLWVALACPTRGLEFDSRTLDLIDDNKDAAAPRLGRCAILHLYDLAVPAGALSAALTMQASGGALTLAALHGFERTPAATTDRHSA